MHTQIETKCLVSIDSLLYDLKEQAHGAVFTRMDIAILKDILRIAQTSVQGERPANVTQQANYAICHSCGVKLSETESRQKNCPYCGEQI